MAAALDALGIPMRDRKGLGEEAATEIGYAIELYRLYQDNEPASIFKSDLEKLSRLQKYIRGMLTVVRGSDSGFSGYFLTPGPDEDLGSVKERTVSMLEVWDKRIEKTKTAMPSYTTPRGGHPRNEAGRYFVAHLHDIFEKYQPGKASSSPKGPFSVFVGHVFELATGNTRKAPSKLIQEVRRHLKGDFD